MLFKKEAVISITIMVMLLLTSLSGCIGPREISQKLMEKFGEKQQYEWDKKLDDEGTFKIIDILNQNWAKVEDYPPVKVEAGTKYMHIYLAVNFSNIVSLGWEWLTPGYANITITDPSGVNTSKEYTSLGKGNEYRDFFYIPNPQKGNWEITLKLWGTGDYKIFVELYEPV